MSKSVIKRLTTQLHEWSREDLIALLAQRPFTAQDKAAQKLEDELVWRWLPNTKHPACVELFDAEDKMLAFVMRRPGYCDRGHWSATVCCIPDLDEADAFPRYFMRLSTAKAELVEFLAWRLLKRRAE